MISLLIFLGIATIIGVIIIGIIETKRSEAGKTSILPSPTAKDRQTKRPKNKATAVTLAVLFGPFAWLCIYSGNNQRKFNISVTIIGTFTLFTMIFRKAFLLLWGWWGLLIITLIIPFGYLIGWV